MNHEASAADVEQSSGSVVIGVGFPDETIEIGVKDDTETELNEMLYITVEADAPDT